MVVDVPDMEFLMLDGEGSPSSGPAFEQAIDTIVRVHDRLRALQAPREARGDASASARRPPLEALWWWAGHERGADAEPHAWRWTLMLRLEAPVDGDLLAKAVRQEKMSGHAPLAGLVRVARHHEGRAMQIMHVGAYRNEMRTIDRLHEDMRHAGLVPAGKHHEIYLDDPATQSMSRVRTLIREPVKWTDEDQA